MPFETSHFYEFGCFRLDAAKRLLWRSGQLVPLTPKAIETLIVLVESHGNLIEKEELMRRLWPDTFVEENNLNFNVSMLRRALDRHNGNRFIETIPKRGYRFIAPVKETRPGEVISPDAEPSLGPAAGSNGMGAARARTGGQRLAETEPPPQSGAASFETNSWLRFALAAVIVVAAATAGYLLIRPLAPPTVRNPRPLTNDGRQKFGTGVSDGLRLYLIESSPQGRVLKSVSVVSGESVESPMPLQNVAILDLSPDKSSLLLGSLSREESFWLWPLPGGSPRRLGDIVGHSATWSEDGRAMVFANGRDLYLANFDGTQPRRIVTLPGETWWVRWSPDGRRLRLNMRSPSSVTVTEGLWEVSADGTGLHALFPRWSVPPSERFGSWTPDGRYFVFQSSRGGKPNLWAIRESGLGLLRRSCEPIRLMDLPQACYDPGLSPDGKRMFFVCRSERGRLEHYNSEEKAWVPSLGGISAEWVTYSPDGNWVAYIKFPEETLWRMRRDGSDLRELTYLPTKVQSLEWSPDGQRIAFNASTPVNPYKNYLVAANGGEEPQELMPGRNEREGIPTWLPDGQRIAFGDVPERFGRGTRNNVIHVLDLITRKQEVLPGSEGFWTARWSPGGRHVAAIKDDDSDPELQRLFLYDLASRKWRDLGADHADNPTWSRDGKFIYYNREAGYEGIFRVRVPSGRPEPVANTDDVTKAGHHWSGLAADDSPLILSDAVGEEVYEVDVNWP